jgi:hypothetical protein
MFTQSLLAVVVVVRQEQHQQIEQVKAVAVAVA